MPKGVIAYFVISGLVAAGTHWRVGHYLIASGISAIASPFAFALFCALRGEALTRPDLKVFLFFVGIAFLLALVIGLGFLIPRRLAIK